VPYASGDEQAPSIVDTDASGVALAVNTLRDFEERTIVDNGDGSITVTFARDDDNADGLDTQFSDTDTTGVTVSGQSTDQAYVAAVLTNNLDGTITIEYNADSGDVAPLAFTDTDSTGLTLNVATVQNYQVLVSEEHTLSFTAPTADLTNGLTITVAGISVELTSDETTPAAVAAKVAKTLSEDAFFAQTARTVIDNLDGSVTMTYLLDDGNVNPVEVETTGTGTQVTVKTARDYLNTEEITDRQVAQSVAQSVAPLQMAAKTAFDENLTKAEILTAIRQTATSQDVGVSYFDSRGDATTPARGSVEGALAAAEAEAAKTSSTPRSVYEAVLASANVPQRAVLEALGIVPAGRTVMPLASLPRSPSEVSGLTPQQIQSLSPITVMALQPQALQVMSASQVLSLSSEQIKVLKPEQLIALLPQLSTGQQQAVTNSQRSALRLLLNIQ
jgi:sulfur carrier protein ThiS